MKKSLLLTLLFFLTNKNYSQTYKEHIHKADSLYKIKEYKKAGTEFDNAFKLKSGTIGNTTFAASAWGFVNDTTKTLFYLNLLADKGWYKKSLIENDSAFFFLHKKDEWNKVLSKFQANLDEFEKDYNKPLKTELENMIIKDQTLRLLIKEAEDKFGRNSKNMKYFWNLITWQDSINEKRIREIINQYGWPGISSVGKKANTAVWLIIQHASLNTQELYLPYLRKSVKQGESKAYDLAYLEDRILSNKGEPQKYGTQIDINPETGKYKLYKLENPENINIRRAEIGLGTIEEYLKMFNIEFKNK